MTLAAGQYHIHTMDGAPVGRSHHEDKSLRPKAIYRLSHQAQAPKWSIERVSHDRYKLSTGHGHATDIHGKVFAVLQDHPKAEEWLIKRHEQHGVHVYTIEKSEKESLGKGWIVPHEHEGDQGVQIEVQLLKHTHSIPPHYPANELFKIEKIED